MDLAPCTGCRRHVRIGDDACPFCGAPATTLVAKTPEVRGRVSRAALAIGIASAMELASCFSKYGGPPPPDESTAPIAKPSPAPIAKPSPTQSASTDAAIAPTSSSSSTP